MRIALRVSPIALRAANPAQKSRRLARKMPSGRRRKLRKKIHLAIRKQTNGQGALLVFMQLKALSIHTLACIERVLHLNRPTIANAEVIVRRPTRSERIDPKTRRRVVDL